MNKRKITTFVVTLGLACMLILGTAPAASSYYATGYYAYYAGLYDAYSSYYFDAALDTGSSTYRYNSWYYAYLNRNYQYQSYYYAPSGSVKEDAAWDAYYYAYYQNLYAQYNYYGYSYDSYQGVYDRENDIDRDLTLLYD